MEEYDIVANSNYVEFCTRYYKKGTRILHRIGGPAIQWISGDEEWHENGKYHRIDGPAVSYKTRKEWWFQGKRHRLDGPAVENIISSYSQWWVDGVRFSSEKEKIANMWYDNEKVLKWKSTIL